VRYRSGRDHGELTYLAKPRRAARLRATSAWIRRTVPSPSRRQPSELGAVCRIWSNRANGELFLQVERIPLFVVREPWAMAWSISRESTANRLDLVRTALVVTRAVKEIGGE
jgi:hypothetical protein